MTHTLTPEAELGQEGGDGHAQTSPLACSRSALRPSSPPPHSFLHPCRRSSPLKDYPLSTSHPLSGYCSIFLLLFFGKTLQRVCCRRSPESPSLPVLSRAHSHQAWPPPLRSRQHHAGPRLPGQRASSWSSRALRLPALCGVADPPLSSCLAGRPFLLSLLCRSILPFLSWGQGREGGDGRSSVIPSALVVSSSLVALMTFKH